jgi:hypothetical protein
MNAKRSLIIRLMGGLEAAHQASPRCFAPFSGLTLSEGPPCGPESKPAGRFIHVS